MAVTKESKLIEIRHDTAGLINANPIKDVGGDIWVLETRLSKGGSGKWQARVACDQDPATCPAKRGVVCNATNTAREDWESRQTIVSLSGSVMCGKDATIAATIQLLDGPSEQTTPPSIKAPPGSTNCNPYEV